MNRLYDAVKSTTLYQVLKAMLLTARYLFKPKVTLNYPHQKAKLSNRFRGELVLKTTDTGGEKCVGCKLCEAICPAQAISIDSGVGADNERRALRFEIDMTKCIYCGLCQEACPVDAIASSSQDEFTVFDRSKLLYDKEKLMDNYNERKADKV